MSKNITDIRSLVYKSLRSKALGRALAQLSVIDNKYADKLQNLKSTYSTLLSYYIEGTEDPERAEVINYLIRETYELTDLICAGYIPVSYCEDDIYKQLFTPLLYDTEHISYAKQLAAGDDAVKAEMAASAVMISCIKVFQEEKFFTLLEFCKSSSKRAKLKAVTAVIICLIYHNERLSYYPKINNSLNLLFDDEENVKIAQTAVLSLLRCTETARISEEIRKNIIPNISKITPDENSGKAPEDKIYEIQDKLEDSGLADKMRTYAELQQEGADINFSSFCQLKNFPFFNLIENWLMPFYKENKSITELFEGQKENMSIVETLLSSSTMCESDRYSLCLNIMAVSDSLRSTLLSNLNAENEAMAEALGNSESDDKIINHYVQDIYRLFKLHRDFKYFTDIFEGRHPYHAMGFYRFINPNNSFLPQTAAFYLSKSLTEDALDAYQKLLTTDSTNIAYYKAIGSCFVKLERYSEALDIWKKADLISSGEESTLKRIALCHKKLGNFSEAGKLYSALLESDSDNLNFIFNVAYCKYMLSDFKGALNYLYKMVFISDDVKRSREFNLYLGVCLWSEGSRKEAVSYLAHYTPLHELEKALRTAPYTFTDEEVNYIVDFVRFS